MEIEKYRKYIKNSLFFVLLAFTLVNYPPFRFFDLPEKVICGHNNNTLHLHQRYQYNHDDENREQNAIKIQFRALCKRKSWNIATEIVGANSRDTFLLDLYAKDTSNVLATTQTQRCYC